ncbi:MAG: hypothetical protein M3O26_10665 [Pseudomonadota bacterium]|nr:hypothetical protein [Pseudomonadota bacterium]
MNSESALKLFLSSPAALFILMMLASLSNGMKQLMVLRQTGTPMSFGAYLKYWPETTAMIIANMIAFAALVMWDQLNFASALGVGYGTNSLVDLLPGKRSIVLKSTPDDPAKIQARTLNPATDPTLDKGKPDEKTIIASADPRSVP